MINKKEVKKIGTLDKVLIFLAIFMVLFIVTMIVLHIVTGSTPDVLITCTFAACIGEFSITGWIKTSKDKRRREKLDTIEECEDECIEDETISDDEENKFHIRFRR